MLVSTFLSYGKDCSTETCCGRPRLIGFFVRKKDVHVSLLLLVGPSVKRLSVGSAGQHVD